MATRGRKDSSYVASLLWLAGIFLVLWGPRPALADGSAMDEAKEKTDSWANWVQDKVTEGLGLRHENARMAAEQMKDAAGNAASKISSAASAHVDDLKMNEILMVHAAKAGGKSQLDQKLMAMLKEESPVPNEKLMAMLKASPLTEEKLMSVLKAEPLNSNSEGSKLNAVLKAEVDQSRNKDGANMATDKVEKAYEGAKEKVKETYETAKNTMTESAKANYEAAKEMASQATGDAGAMMQQKTAGEL